MEFDASMPGKTASHLEHHQRKL